MVRAGAEDASVRCQRRDDLVLGSRRSDVHDDVVALEQLRPGMIGKVQGDRHARMRSCKRIEHGCDMQPTKAMRGGGAPRSGTTTITPCVEAAAAGLGVALSPLVLAVDDVERGSLAAPAGFDSDFQRTLDALRNSLAHYCLHNSAI